MNLKKTLYFLFPFFIAGGCVCGQTTYLPLGSPEYHLLDRLETRQGTFQHAFQHGIRPVSRKDAVAYLLETERATRIGQYEAGLSDVDRYDISRALSISGEWAETADGDDGAIDSKHTLLGVFYKKQPDFIHVHTDDFFLVVNPVLYSEPIKELKSTYGTGYVNTRGLEIRGRITDRIGFYTYLADNQEKPVSFVQDWAIQHNASPGVDFNIRNGANFDIFNARGYIDLSLWKEHINLTFGYDKQFLGDGIRSLVMSDFSAPATFLRLKSQFGHWSYQNLFLELTADWTPNGDNFYDKKYAAIHSLNYTPLPWLNIGIFESTIFGGLNKFNPFYLEPVIGVNRLSTALGRDAKSSLGGSFKILPVPGIQVYGQAFIDRLSLSHFSGGYWGNQFGAQLGAKYFDVAGIRNLDLQIEGNIIRPFTYSAHDSVLDYTNFNQPLAHPLGAAFAELIGDVSYQPFKKWYFSARGIYTRRGVNGGTNMGNDIFMWNNTRIGDEGYNLFSGEKMQGFYANVNVAYELRPNLFLEAGGATLRRKQEASSAIPAVNWFYGGLRLNIARRQYDFY